LAEFTPDPQQKLAIEHVHGPMLVVAGAGTGKTTVLVERVVSLIEKGHARPDEILAVTFSDNSARELRERVASKLGPDLSKSVQARTFHSYCFELLKRAKLDFTPLTKEDLYVLLRRDLKSLGLKYYIRAARPGQFLQALLTFFERCDDELVTVERYRDYLADLKAGKHDLPRVLKQKDAEKLKREEVLERCDEIASVFVKADKLLTSKRLGTFGQLISQAVKLLESNWLVLAEERSHARFILIDEFQDSNVAQIRLAKLLAGDEANVFAVGDPDQAIYRFRGATTGAFDQFQKHFSGVKFVTLNQNRRSLSPILRCAYKVIHENPPIMTGGQLQRTALTAAREALSTKNPTLPTAPPAQLSSPPVQLIYTPLQFSGETEAAEIADEIERLPGHSTRMGQTACSWKDIAVLYRTHRNRELLAAELSRRKIPIDVRGVDVLETPEVRDALAAMRAIANTGDSAALFRVASLPRFGIHPDELRIALRNRERDTRLLPVLEKVQGGSRLLEALQQAQALAAPRRSSAVVALETAIKQFGVANTPATAALKNFVKEWSKKPITDDPSIASFLEYLEYFVEAGGKICLPDPKDGEEPDAVQFMSAHGAKGLEFPHVFILRATTNSFPSAYREDLFEFPQALRDSLTLTEGEAKALHQQEERRLFYVAMTRARDTLAMYGKRSRSKKQATPPRFLEATPPGFLRDIADDRALGDACAARVADFRPEIQAAANTVQAFSSAAEWMLLPPLRDMEKMTLSATRIENYETCPLRFKMEADWNLPGEPVPAMQFGNAVHTALKGYYDAVRAGRPLTREQFLNVFQEQLAISPFDDPHQKDLYYKQGIDQLGEFYDLRNREAVPSVLATEKFFELMVDGVKVVGRIDRTDQMPDGSIAIVDYKTGAPRDQEDADESLQLSVYALATEQEWKQLPSRIAFYNLETNATSETIRTPEQLTAVRQKIAQVAASVCAGKFDPKPGLHCNSCGFREVCPVQEEPLWMVESGMPAKASR
jgi:DNA helicase-2/ATP-dependent DNA helicase PcrA